MSHRWAALALVLALCAFTPKYAAGQTSQPRGRKAGALGQNYPNPFNPHTFFPFTVGDSTCLEGSGQHTVSMTVYNVLAQPVATPVLMGPGTITSLAAGATGGQPLRGLVLACGNYTAFWDGFYQGTRREAASGVYVYELVVDGVRHVKRMLSAK